MWTSTHTEENQREEPHRPEWGLFRKRTEDETRGDEKGMLSNAGREPVDKELRVTGGKKGKNFKKNGVVNVNVAKKFSQRTEEVSNG